ncbi:MAG: type I 3-dehydroquinate dehydratase [Leptospiraceae bacterium]|nr:type I 3-dehydroquinate dehydratase [Leptospiraceae bacterium]
MKNSPLKIVLTLDQKELSSLNRESIKKVDYLEIRFDLLTKKFVETILIRKLVFLEKPLIFTIRKSKDSSLKQVEKIPEDMIFQILDEFNTPRNYLDIEMDSRSIFTQFKNNKFSNICSLHDFKKSISKKKMESLILKNFNPGKKQIFKFAVTPKNIEEVAIFLDNISSLAKKYSVAAIAMGEIGAVSRIFGDQFGSILTYCCLNSPKAPGQISIAAMNLFRKF